jgi:hypothetical protein
LLFHHIRFNAWRKEKRSSNNKDNKNETENSFPFNNNCIVNRGFRGKGRIKENENVRKSNPESINVGRSL